jgi:hypothetical protein
MTIKFICSCGKHLKARDEMAARRSICPRCGAPVGIPARQPTHEGTSAGPMTPIERLKAQRLRPPTRTLPDATPLPKKVVPQRPPARAESTFPTDEAVSAPQPPDPALVRQVLARTPHLTPRKRQMEERWYQCLFYPFRAWFLVFGLAIVLTVLTGCLALLIPHFLAQETTLGMRLLLGAPAVFIVLMILGYVCAFLDCVLASATAGEVGLLRWPGRNLGLALKSCVTWLVCFLAGPILLLGGGIRYWIYCGDPVFLDWWILSEVAVLAIIYWLLALLAVSQKDRLLDANPLRVVQLVQRVGHRVVAVALGAAVLILGHGLLFLNALELLHNEPGVGWFLLLTCFVNGLFLATFLFRLLGVWCHSSRKKVPLDTAL